MPTELQNRYIVEVFGFDEEQLPEPVTSQAMAVPGGGLRPGRAPVSRPAEGDDQAQGKLAAAGGGPGGKKPAGPSKAEKLKVLNGLKDKGVKFIKLAGGEILKVLELLGDLDKVVPAIWDALLKASKVAHDDIKDGFIYLAGIAKPALTHVSNTTGDIVADAETKGYHFGIRWAKQILKNPPEAPTVSIDETPVDFVGPKGKDSGDFDNWDYKKSVPVLRWTKPLTDSGSSGPVIQVEMSFSWTCNKHFMKDFRSEFNYGAGAIPDDCKAHFTITSSLAQASGDVGAVDFRVDCDITYKGRPMHFVVKGRAAGNGVGRWD